MCPGWITGAGLLWLCSCREVVKVGCQAGAKPTATVMLAALVFSISGPWTKSTYAASAAYAKGCWGRGMPSQNLLLSQPAWPLCSSYGEVHLWALTCGVDFCRQWSTKQPHMPLNYACLPSPCSCGGRAGHTQAGARASLRCQQ